jgi:hypothetical protein
MPFADWRTNEIDTVPSLRPMVRSMSWIGLWEGERILPPSPLFAAACGARVGHHDLCRETHRRRGGQRLAPLPEFCSPSCPMCSVILDVRDEQQEAEDAASRERVRVDVFRYQTAKRAAAPDPRWHRIQRGLARARARP